MTKKRRKTMFGKPKYKYLAEIIDFSSIKGAKIQKEWAQSGAKNLARKVSDTRFTTPNTPTGNYNSKECLQFIKKDESFGGNEADIKKICRYVENQEYKKYPILLYGDNELLDGWHRLYAATISGEKKIDVIFPTKRTKTLNRLLKNSGFYSDLNDILKENQEMLKSE